MGRSSGSHGVLKKRARPEVTLRPEEVRTLRGLHLTTWLDLSLGDPMPPSATVAHIAMPLLGVSTGLRSFTPVAATAWFARTGGLPVENTWASWIAHPAAVGAFTAAAVGEYIADKLPNAPDRTAPVPLAGRLALGGLVGAVVATAFRRPWIGGVALGALGALAGSYGGFYARRGLTRSTGFPDLPVALAGDTAAVVLAVRSLRRLTS